MLDLTDYKLTFDDEFNARSISQMGAGTKWADIRSNWRYDANSDIGFGKSSFVDPASGYDPFKVAGGALTITAVPDRTPYGYPGSWESGLITTKGNFSQTYGYFEMRADLSSTPGAWDAFWLLPDQPAANPNNLPGHQELDVVEHYGTNEGGVYSHIHTIDARSDQSLQFYSSHSGLTSAYHTYGMDWQADVIKYYFDGQYMGSRATPSDMHGPMYLLANLATEISSDASMPPMSMSIDYIRAYSKASDAIAVQLDTISAPDGQDPGTYNAFVALPQNHPVGLTANPLVDDSFYFAHYPALAALAVSAASHYDATGWHEGKDPDAFFSTTGYLAANPDVAKAGINPLGHYDQYGWKEGRDPSANFDNQLYLAHNPDVKAAGIDPLAHYLQYGQAEGRQAYAAIGKAADLGTHPGFDAEYYLLSNVDVAKAALSTGGDTFAFAYQHYETYGWHEGRNPNAVFDTKGYLAAYADVKAANVDPLAHYDTYGFKEGRDPSAGFDTKAYVAHYGDVANAHIDPMLHYLQYGALEGRSAFADGHFG